MFAKKYCREKRENFDHDAPIKLALNRAHQTVLDRYKSFHPRSDTTLQTVVFDQAFYRAFGTLKTVVYLARRGLLYETALVARGFIEQVAWARQAGDCVSEDELFKLSIHRSVTALKSIYPTAGQIYGRLSKLSHFDATTHSNFYGELDGGVATVFASRETKFSAMVFSFVLIDLWLTVFESFYPPKSGESVVKTQLGSFRSKRLAVHQFGKYYSGLGEYADAQFAEPWTKPSRKLP